MGAFGTAAAAAPRDEHETAHALKVRFTLNGVKQELEIDPRATLLDTLRDRYRLTGTKKGCDRGQCGACTVLVNGRRVNSCLTLAATLEGAAVTSIEGLAKGSMLHPVQEAFVKRDAFQCGYCTPGQIMSCVALHDEVKHGMPSYVTADLSSQRVMLTDEEIRERMSGNICRCGAYVNIVAAVRDTAGKA